MMNSKESKNLKVNVAVTLAIFVLFIASESLAMTAPAAGSFAYDIYDIGVNSILKGPIGFVGGIAAVVVGAILAIKQMLLPAVCALLGGAFFIRADSIVGSMGALIC